MAGKTFREIERNHDTLRKRVFEIAEHLDAVAGLEENVARFGLPDGKTDKEQAAANAKFLRGEAELLKKAAEEIEEEAYVQSMSAFASGVARDVRAAKRRR